jgi:hypothetical protein
MRTSSIHCERILALIDACLDEMGDHGDESSVAVAPSARGEITNAPGASTPVKAGHEGGLAS